MKYGYPTNPGKNIISEIKKINKMGFDFPELFVEEPLKTKIIIKNKVKIKKLLSEFKAPTIIHTAFWIDFSSTYGSIRKVWIHEAKKIIDSANAIGVKTVNFHILIGYAINKRQKLIRLNNFVASIKDIENHARKHNIKIILENKPRMPIDDVIYVLRKLPQVGFHLDIGHAYMNGRMTAIQKYMKILGKRIAHIHMHDNHGTDDEHLPIGKGTINYNNVVAMLKKMKYDNTITLEVFTNERDAVKSREKIRKIFR